MNDRAVSVLSEYDVEVLRTWKGRGAILFETPQGIRILKEYAGYGEKLSRQKALLSHIRERAGVIVEEIFPNKEGALSTKDSDGCTYVVKSYFEGRECNIRDEGECLRAMAQLAYLHKNMTNVSCDGLDDYPIARMDREYEKHNRELKKVRKYLQGKSQKNDFEIYLLQNYDVFLEKAFAVTGEWKACQPDSYYDRIEKEKTWCHGDYQYHNILFSGNGIYVINFEKCVLDHQVRDLYLFLRKLLEKNSWSEGVGRALLEAYQEERPLEKEDRLQLYYRLSYPEKFWKIVNFYYNSGKAWIPGRNMEKLEKLLRQEKDKERFLKQILRL